MKSKSFLSRPLLAAGLALVLTGGALAGGVVIAQTAPQEPIQWDRRRLEQLDRNVRRLERALTQRNAAGEPVLIQTDPEVVALQGRVSSMDNRLQDLEATVQRMNGDLERLNFSIEEGGRDNEALRGRLTDAEARVVAIEAAAEQAALNGPVAADSPTGDADGDLQAAIRLAAEDPTRGARALETVAVTWPDTPEGREANSRLGDARVSAGDQAGAVQAYASALSGWPRVAWAGETTVKLAAALEATDNGEDSCAALAEFRTRYGATATPALRSRAAQIGGRAGCD